MKIDLAKHQKTELDELDRAIGNIERIYDEAINLVKDNDLKEIIEIAVRWYENKETRGDPENLLYYTFFNDAFNTTLGPSHFYGDLGSFLANCLLDDSYYELKWKTFDRDVRPIEGTPWKDEPYVVWASDSNPGATQKSSLLLKAMKFAIQREKDLMAKREEWENFKEEHYGKQAK